MLLLAFDTAGPECAAALADGASGAPRIVARRSERIGRGHAEALMPMVDEVLAEAGVDYADLRRIAVTTGPGSFTGVRVGIAAARALGLALDIPVVGVGTLQALGSAASRSRSSGTAVTALDAKRAEIYVFAKEISSGAVRFAASAMAVDAAADALRGSPEPLVLTGSGAPLLAHALGGSNVLVVGTAESPDVSDVALLGLAATPGKPPAPLYLRGADAKPQADKSVALL
jgi:tRNA threonylcarbamoyladenosine biosynthesis protein TsaB